MKPGLLFLLLYIPLIYKTQQSIVAAGGDATGTGGTMSHSSGLTDYLYFSSEGGSMQMGVQQVYDVYVLFSWTGAQSMEWRVAENWNVDRVPYESEDVIMIPSGKPHYPILDAIQITGELTIESEASLTIAPDGRLTVTGTLENHGGVEGLLVESDASGTGSLIHYTSDVSAVIERHIPVPSGAQGSWDNGHGWHLLGNPFASAIIWDVPSGDWNLDNVSGVAKVWEEASRSYIDITTNGGYLHIPAGQGFFVQVNNASNHITIPASARTHEPDTWYKDT